jgi:hypothetical protein
MDLNWNKINHNFLNISLSITACLNMLIIQIENLSVVATGYNNVLSQFE